MTDSTDTLDIVWDGDVAVCADPETVECENPYDWTPLHMEDVPVEQEPAS